MEYFEITKEMMLKATTYMPLSDKEVLARKIAVSCLRPMQTAVQNKPAEQLIALPMMMEENCAVKLILLMNTLLGFYFDIELEETDDPYARYDYYAGGHLFNQIERFKGDKDTKDIAFDILEDFREFKKMVDVMVYNEKANANDPLARFSAAIEVLSTPENIKTLVGELQKSSDEMADKIKNSKILDPIPEA